VRRRRKGRSSMVHRGDRIGRAPGSAGITERNATFNLKGCRTTKRGFSGGFEWPATCSIDGQPRDDRQHIASVSRAGHCRSGERPTTANAGRLLEERGMVIIPDIVANAGA
jgi:hypothetical protein